MRKTFREIGKGLLAAKGAPLIGLAVSLVVLVGTITYAPQAQHALGFQGPNVLVPTDTVAPTDTPTPTDTPLPVATNTPVPAPDLVVRPTSLTLQCVRGQAAQEITITNTGSVGHAWNTGMSDPDFSVHPFVSDGVLAAGAAQLITVGGLAPSGTTGRLIIYQGGRYGEEYSVAAVVDLSCA